MKFPSASPVLLSLVFSSSLVALPEQAGWLGHDRTRPLPPVVTPGSDSSQDKPGAAPSDAVVLYNGSSLAGWTAMNGEPTKWINRDGAMECVPGSGYIRTLQGFGACQLHIEFATPNPPHGKSQGRGNSGVFFSMGRYEIQVLDSYQNDTYADGGAGAVYDEYPPLVNASRPPGQWQSYDMVWSPPKFAADGALVTPPFLTVFHNGVLIQNHVELFGANNGAWFDRLGFKAHPEKLPIVLQDHGNPVRFRNVWIRELTGGKPEFYLPDALLDTYAGNYENNIDVVRRDGRLLMTYRTRVFELYAESNTRFFAKDIDIQAVFDAEAKTIQVSVGEDGGEKRKKK